MPDSEVKVPEDLRRLYRLAKQDLAWVRTADDVALEKGERISPHPDVTTLIERTARVEQERDQLALERDAAMIGQTVRQAQFERMSELADEAILQRDQLRASLQEHCVVMEYDYTGYVAEPCGYYCSLCHCPVNDDKVTGHRKDCVLNGSQVQPGTGSSV